MASDKSEERELAGKISVEFEVLKSSVAARRRGLVPEESGCLRMRNSCSTYVAKEGSNEFETTVEKISDGIDSVGIQKSLELTPTSTETNGGLQQGKMMRINVVERYGVHELQLVAFNEMSKALLVSYGLEQ